MVISTSDDDLLLLNEIIKLYYKNNIKPLININGSANNVSDKNIMSYIKTGIMFIMKDTISKKYYKKLTTLYFTDAGLCYYIHVKLNEQVQSELELLTESN